MAPTISLVPKSDPRGGGCGCEVAVALDRKCASANYTEQVVSRLLAAASAKGDGGALGAIETAARWWGAGLGSATVTPANSDRARFGHAVRTRHHRPGVVSGRGKSACNRRTRRAGDVDPVRSMDYFRQ